MESTSSQLNFHILVKPIGPVCNLQCRYCFYLEKESLYPENHNFSDWMLPENILEEFTRQYIASQPGSVVNFAWQGGEPTLLGVDYFRKAIELQKKHANGKRIENTLQTNGILLDDSWCEFLAANKFLVGLSVDGPEPLHDQCRIDRGGGPSFQKVMRNIGLLKKHGVEFNTLTVVQKYNSQHPLATYRFLKDLGHGFMQFIPIIERVAEEPASSGSSLASPNSFTPAKITEWSVEPLQYGRFLSAIFDDWVRNDVGKIYVQIFDISLSAWAGMEPALCVFQRSCGTSAVLEHNGDLYSCDHYVYPENRLGNILEAPLSALVNSEQQLRFGRNKEDLLPRCCWECPVRFICNGECPKHRFLQAPGGETNLNYLCAGYKHFFTHIAPYMEFMAAELQAQRPPANVMNWVLSHDLSISGKSKPGRNDQCPCGSGLKYKRCCGQIR
jgi:uncharacterized protein